MATVTAMSDEQLVAMRDKSAAGAARALIRTTAGAIGIVAAWALLAPGWRVMVALWFTWAVLAPLPLVVQTAGVVTIDTELDRRRHLP